MNNQQPAAKPKIAAFYTRDCFAFSAGTELQARLFGEIHFDTYHVRSQTKLSGTIQVSLPLIELGADDLWLPEMIRTENPAALSETPPDGVTHREDAYQLLLEHFTLYKDKVVETILRYHRIRLLHHPALKLFSEVGESRSEFEARCLDILHSGVQEELRELQHRYERMMDGIIQKSGLNYMQSINDDPTTDRVMSGQKQMIFSTRDGLTRIFQDLRDLPDCPPADRAPSNDVEDALASLYQQSWADAKSVADRLQQQIGLIEEYTFHLQYGDIAMVQLALLWEPV
ncbi:MAG TPA: hypothetical protein PKN61_07290 [Acidobacteriota bacterium]|nr:hypothetical protein [Acidobacteriota bacterium]HNR38825.1 hypothetical protein [Acidobacteriota bacterium]HNU00346.1 hypothetical protein [Acidobacteriota bacterium]HPB27214.1 hypothetical protein [Acidobacteriota bacterium]HQO25019.1 hypothetical protein [Acidobacteriota bacterium]